MGTETARRVLDTMRAELITELVHAGMPAADAEAALADAYTDAGANLGLATTIELLAELDARTGGIVVELTPGGDTFRAEELVAVLRRDLPVEQLAYRTVEAG
jgi:hypothetical protein